MSVHLALGLKITPPSSTFTIQIPVASFTGIVSWGDGSNNTYTNTSNISKTYSNLTIGLEYEFTIEFKPNTSNTINLSSIIIPATPSTNIMNYRDSLTSFIYYKKINSFTNFSSLFYGASRFYNLDIPIQDDGLNRTNNVTNMSNMFRNAIAFNDVNLSINSLNTTNVTTMANMFDGASSFNSLLTFNTSKVTDFSSMFRNATTYNKTTTFNLSSATTIANMFDGATNFESNYIFEPRGPGTLSGTLLSGSYTGITTTDAFKNVKNRNIDVSKCYLELVFDLSVNMIKTGVNAGSQNPIQLPTINFNGYIDWGDNSNILVSSTNVEKTYSPEFAASVNYEVTVKFYDVFRMSTFSATNSSYRKCLKRFNYINKIESFRNYTSLFSVCSLINDINFNGISTEDVINMSSMFSGASNFNSSLEWLNTKNVATMASMFRDATLFNQPVVFNTSNVQTMTMMFQGASIFDQPINFDLSSCTSLSYMFSAGSLGFPMVFNKSINFINTTNVTNVSSMFRYNKSFNQPVTLNIPKVNGTIQPTNIGTGSGLTCMFQGASGFNSPVDLTIYDPSFIVTNQSISAFSMFEDAKNFNSTLKLNDTRNVTIMTNMFKNATAFNQPFSSGFNNTGKVTTMTNMFSGATSFNQLINFKTTLLTNISGMFSSGGNPSFGSDFSDLSKVTNATLLFWNNNKFNNDVSFNLSSCTTLSQSFQGTSNFSSNIKLTLSSNSTISIDASRMFEGSSIGTGNSTLTFNTTERITNMSSMFKSADYFNLPVSFNTINVTNMSQMFSGASTFNKPVNFNFTNVTNMEQMFLDANAFNQPINLSSTKCNNYKSMFSGASVFNQPLNLNLTYIAASSLNNIFDKSGIDINNYSIILYNFNNTGKTGITDVGVDGLDYNAIPYVTDTFTYPSGRTSVTNLTNKGWTFKGHTDVNLQVQTYLTINGSSFIEKQSTDASFQLSIDSNIPPSYAICDMNGNRTTSTNVLFVDSSGIVTINGSGNVKIEAYVNPTTETTAASVFYIIKVYKVNSILTINNLINNGFIKNRLDGSFNIVVNSNNTQLPINYEVVKVNKLVDDGSGNLIPDPNNFEPSKITINKINDNLGKVTFVSLGYSQVRIFQTETTYSKYASTEQIVDFYVKENPIYQYDSSFSMVYNSIKTLTNNIQNLASNNGVNNTYKFITNSSGNLIYSSNNTNVVAITNNGTIRSGGVGTAKITIIQETTNDYFQSQVDFFVNVYRATPVLSKVFVNPNIAKISKTYYNDKTFNIFTDVVFSTTNSDLYNYNFSIENTNVASIDTSGNITINNAESTIIRVFNPQTTNFFQSNTLEIPFEVVKVTPTISTKSLQLTRQFNSGSFNIGSAPEIDISSNNTQTNIIYELSNSTDASFITLDFNGNVSIKKVGGPIKINAYQIGTTNFLPSVIKEITLTLNRVKPIIYSNSSTITGKKYNDPVFDLVELLDISSNNTEIPLEYQSSNDSIASINAASGIVTIKQSGSVQFTISQLDTNNYERADTITISMNIGKDTPTLQADNYSISGYRVGDKFNLKTLLNINSTNTDTTNFDYNSSNKSSVDIDANGNVTINKIGTGNFVLTVSQGETTNYLATSIDISLNNIIRGITDIDISGNEITVGYQNTIDLFKALKITTNNPEIAIDYKVDNLQIARVNGSGILTGLKNGVTNIIISQEQTINYLSDSKTISLTVTKGTPIITTYNESIVVPYKPLQTFNIKEVLVDISSNNTETGFDYDINDDNIASIDGSGNITLKKIGNTTINIKQINTTNYFPVTKSISLTVSSSTNKITADNYSFTKVYGSDSFNLKDFLNIKSDNAESNFKYSTIDSSYAIINENGTVTLLQSTIDSSLNNFEMEFKVEQYATLNYDAAIPIIIKMKIDKSPTLIKSISNTLSKTINYTSSTFNLFSLFDISSNNTESNYIFTLSDASAIQINSNGNFTISSIKLFPGFNIKVKQLSNVNYIESNELNLTLIINKGVNVITTDVSSININYSLTPVSLSDFVNISSLHNQTNFAYSISDASFATINQSGTIQIIKSTITNQPITITVSQSESDYYSLASIPILLNINKLLATTSVTKVESSRTFNDPTFNLISEYGISSNNNEVVGYSYVVDSSGSNAISITQNGTVTINNAFPSGVKIFISKPISTNYNASIPVEVKLIINKATAPITVTSKGNFETVATSGTTKSSYNSTTNTLQWVTTPLHTSFDLNTFFNITSLNNTTTDFSSNLTKNFTLKTLNNVVTSIVDITSANELSNGTSAISAGNIVIIKKETENYLRETFTLNITTIKAIPSLSFASKTISKKVGEVFNPFAGTLYGGFGFSSSNGATSNNITFSSGGTTGSPPRITIDNINQRVTVSAVTSGGITGYATFGVSYSPNNTFLRQTTFAANTFDLRVNISKGDSIINISNNTSNITKQFGNAFNLKTDYSITSTNKESSIIFSSSDPSFASIDPISGYVQILKYKDDGPVVFTISQAGTDNYDTAQSKTISMVINKATTDITISKTIITKTYTIDTSFNLQQESTISSNNNEKPIRYESLDLSFASIDPSSGNVQILNAKDDGPVTFNISQESSDNYEAASKTIQLFINKLTTNIDISGNSITKQYITDTSFNLKDTFFISSNHNERPIRYTSSDPSFASVDPSSGDVQIVKVKDNGPVIFTISQETSNNYAPAYKTITLFIQKALATIDISGNSITKQYITDVSFNLKDVFFINSNHNEKPILYESSDPSFASVDPINGTVQILKYKDDGPVIFTVSQESSDNYELAESKTITLNINKADAIIDISGNNITKQYITDVSFNLKDTFFINSNHNEEPIKYASSEATFASVDESGNVIINNPTKTIDGLNNPVIFTISQSQSNNYNSATSKYVSLTIEKADNTIRYNKQQINITYGTTESFDIKTEYDISSNNLNTNYEYINLDPSYISIDSTGRVTILKATLENQPARIRILQSESQYYKKPEPIEVRLIIEKANNVIKAQKTDITKIYSNSLFDIRSIYGIKTSHSENTLKFSSSDPSYASIDTSGYVNIIRSTYDFNGSNNPVIFTILQEESTNYKSSSIQVLLTIQKKQNEIRRNITELKKTYSITPFNIATIAEINSDNSETNIIYNISDPSYATIDSSGNIQMIRSTYNFDGSNNPVIITISQAESINYSAATDVFISLTVQKITSSIKSNFDSKTKTYGNNSFNILNEYVISSNNVETKYEFISSDPSYATIDSSGNINIIRSTYDLNSLNTPVIFTIKQPETINYTLSSKVVSLTINKLETIITPTLLEIFKKIYDESTFNLNDLLGIDSNHNETPIQIISLDPSYADIDISRNVTMRKSTYDLNGINNPVRFLILKAESTNYKAASKTIYMTIDKAENTITSDVDEFSVKFKSDISFNLVSKYNIVSSHNENNLIFTSSDPSYATIDNNGVVYILKPNLTGVVFTINQPATINYKSSIKNIKMIIKRADTNIVSPDNISATFNDVSFNLISKYNITTNNTEKILQFKSNNLSLAEIDDNGIVYIKNPGVVRLDILQDESDNYSKGFKYINLTINKKETIIDLSDNQLEVYFSDISFNLLDKLTITTNHQENEFSFESLDSSFAEINSSGVVTILGANNNVRLLVKKLATTNYLPQTKEIKLIIKRINTIIDISSNSLTKKYDILTFNLKDELNISTNNKETSINYEALDPSFASIDSSGNVTMIKSGTARFNVLQNGTNNYISSTILINLTIDKVNTVINSLISNSSVNPLNVTFSNNIFNLKDALNIISNNKITTFKYDSLDPSYATIDTNGNVSILRSGDASFMVSQDNIDNYNRDEKIFFVKINKATPIFDIPSTIIKKYGDQPFNLDVSYNNKETNIKYESVDLSSATIDSQGNVTILKANPSGTNIIIYQDETTNYTSRTFMIKLIIQRQQNIISYQEDIELEYNSNNTGTLISNLLDFSSNNTDSNTFIYNVDNESIVEVIQNNRLITKSVGSTFITISQAETNNFSYGQAIVNVVVNRQESTITNDPFKRVVFGDTFNVLSLFNVSTNNIGGSYNFKYSPSLGFIEIDSIGNTTIKKSSPSIPIQIVIEISESANYTSATSLSMDLYIDKKTTILTANKSGLINYIDAMNYSIYDVLTFFNSNSENFSYSFSSTNTSVATIDASGIINVNDYTSGNTDIIVTSSATENYTSKALTIPLSVVNKLLSNMRIRPSNIINRSYTDGNFNINDLITIDTSNNETNIKYESLNINKATINQDTGLVNVLIPGTVTIRAYQISTPSYTQDEELITLNISKIPNTINATKIETTKNLIDSSFNLITEYGISSDNLQDSFTFTTTSTKINILQDGTVNMLEGTLNEDLIMINVIQNSNLYENVILNLSLKINPQLETIINAENINNIRKTYNIDASFNILELYQITSNSDASYSFQSLNTEYLTVNDLGIATILNATPVTPVKIKVNKLESTFYKFKSITLDLYIDKFFTNITTDSSNVTTVFNNNLYLDLKSEYGIKSNNNVIPFTYESLDPSYATITTTGIIYVLRATTQPITLRISQIGNNNYTTAIKDVKLIVNKYITVITKDNTTVTKTYRKDTTFNLFNEYKIQSNNNIPFTFEFLDSQYISINSSGIVSILNANTNMINILVKQLGDENNNGSFVEIALLINKYPTSITSTINKLTDRKTYKTDNNFNLLTNYEIQSDVERSLIPYTFVFDSSFVQVDPSGTVNIIKSSPITPIKLQVKQLENNNYKEGKIDLDLFIDRKTPNLIVPLLNINKQEGEAPFNLEVSSENNESMVLYNSSNNSVITVDNKGFVTINSDGSANLIISQNESVNYNGINNIIVNIFIANNTSSNPLNISTNQQLTHALTTSKSQFIALNTKEFVIVNSSSQRDTTLPIRISNKTIIPKKIIANNVRVKIITKR